MKRLSTAVAGFGLFAGSLVIGGAGVWQPPAAAPTADVKVEAKKGPVERWYVVMMQGKRAGYMNSKEVTVGDQITSTSDMHMEIKRGTTAMKIVVQTEFVETTDGKPVSMSTTQELGAKPKTTVTIFNADGSSESTTNGDPKTLKKSPAPKDHWLTPAASERYVQSELAKGSKEITEKTIDPTAGTGVMTVTRKIIDTGNIDVFGKTVPAVKWESTADALPGIKQIEYVNAQGEVLKSVLNMGFITLEQLAADKDLAMSKLDGPELLDSTMVKPSRPLHDPRHIATATYRVNVDKDEMPDLPTVAGQTFKREDTKSGLIMQDAKGIEPVAAADLEATKTKYLESSSMVKADDEEIVALVKRAKVDGLKSPEAAEKLRKFVNRFITKKNMEVGFGTASEVARSKTGDCTEHAVLLAALLRADGIPSRCASGLVYVDEYDGKEGIFGYHMWTQAMVEQKDGSWAWENVDATLPNVPYDAAHVLLSVSGLGDDEMQNFLVTTAPLIGRLKIAVVETK